MNQDAEILRKIELLEVQQQELIKLTKDNQEYIKLKLEKIDKPEKEWIRLFFIGGSTGSIATFCLFFAMFIFVYNLLR